MSWTHPAPRLATLAALVVLAAGCVASEPPVDWSAEARQELLAAGLDEPVVDCVLDLARRDLRRGPLPELAAEELSAHCTRARAAIVGATVELGPDAELALTDVPWTLGDDPALDRLWQGCEGGSGAACDQLFDESPVGSDYEEFGVSCGRRPDVLDCRELDDGGTEGGPAPAGS